MTAQAQQQSPIRLWEGAAPGALGAEDRDIPTLTPFLPKQPNGTAIVICPGGGYWLLADHEGRDYAQWLVQHGITSFVLKYRLGQHGYRHPVMWQDAARAVRTVRARAAEWKIDRLRIGIMGSSAGGHLASTLLTRFDGGNAKDPDPIERESCRPDFGILCYPVISLIGPYAHQASAENLLGKNPPLELRQLLSAERQVSAQTPPTFLWHTLEDTGVPPENSIAFAESLRRQGVPFELHLYEKGKHGIGLGNGHPWTHDCLHWLRQRDWLTPQAQ